VLGTAVGVPVGAWVGIKVAVAAISGVWDGKAVGVNVGETSAYCVADKVEKVIGVLIVVGVGVPSGKNWKAS
jgi:hypothetical protein